jgi:hypothetical protein
MAEFTFLKLELDEFVANAPFSGGEEAEIAEEIADAEGEGPGSLAALVVGLLFLIVLAVAVRKVRGGGSEDDEIEE